MATNEIRIVINAQDNSSAALKALSSNINNLKGGLASLGNNTTTAANRFTSLNTSASKSPSLFNRITSAARSLFGGITSGGKSSSTAFQELNTVSENTGGTLSRMKDRASDLLTTFLGFKAVNSIFSSIGNEISGAFTRLDTMDLFQRKMEMITHSSDKATYALDALKTATKGTPYALDAAAKAVQNFVVRGLETEDAVSSVEIWMDAVSAYGDGTTETLNSVLDAIGKMRTKGSVEMRYLNRLFNAGINPVQMYAKATGMAASEVQSALSDKTILAEEFLGTVEKAMREGTNGVLQVEGMAKRLATTWSATFANMKIAIRRGWANVIEDLDDAFTVLNDNGLKGIVKAYGETIESVLTQIGDFAKKALQPILKIFKSIGNGLHDYFIKPFQESMEQAKQPITDTINGIRDNFRKITNTFKEEWDKIIKNNDLSVPSLNINFGAFTNNSLSYFSNLLVEFNKVIPQIMKNIQPVIIEAHELFLILFQGVQSLLNGLDMLIRKFGAIVVPKALPFIVNTFKLIGNVVSSVIRAITHLSALISPLIDTFFNFFGLVLDGLSNVIDKWNQWIESLNTSTLFVGLGSLGANISKSLTKGAEDLNTFFKTLQVDRKVSSDIELDIVTPKTPTLLEFVTTLSHIFDNIVKLVTRSIRALQPLIRGFFDLFNGNFDVSGVSNGLYEFLEVVEAVTSNIADNVPIWINRFAIFAEQALGYIYPVGKFLWDLIINYIVPFGMALFNAFGNIVVALLPVADALGAIAFAVAQFVLPVAFTVLTGLLNWVAKNANLVVGALLGIVAGFLMFKLIDFISTTISTICTVFRVLKFVLLSELIPAIVTFFQVWQTQGLIAAFSNLANPIFWIGLLVAAIVALGVWLAYLWNTSEEFRDKVTAVWNVVCEVFQAVITIAFYPIIAAIKLVVDAFNWLMEKCQPFADAVNGVKDAITGWFDEVTGKDAAGETKNAVDESTNAIEDGAQGLQGAGQSYMVNFEQGLQDYMPDTAGMANQMVADFQNASQTGMDSATLDPTTYMSQLTPEGFDTTALGAQIPQGISDGVNANSETATNTVAGLAGGIQGQFNTAFDSNLGANFMTGLNTTLAEQAPIVYETAGNISRGIINEIVGKANENMEVIYQTAILLLGRFKQGLTDGSVGITENMQGAVDGVTLPLNALGESMYIYGTSSLERFRAGIQDGTPTAVQQAFDLKTQILEQLRLIPQDSYSIGSSTVNSFHNGVVDNESEIYLEFIEIANTIGTTLETRLSTAFSSVKDTVSSLAEEMSTTVSEALDPLDDSLQELAQSMLNTVQTDFVNFVNSTHQVLDPLKDYFSTIGNDMMTNLASGIQDKINEPVEKLEELVQKLKDTFEKKLGIHSPSDYMIWIGQMMLAGLMLGLNPETAGSFAENTIMDMQHSFEAGNFKPEETMDYLSQTGALDLIAKVTDMDLSAVENADPGSVGVPAIIQEALKHVGYHGEGGLNGTSMFGRYYGNNGAWCVSFVRYCAEKAGVPFPATNYVPDVVSWAKNNGRWTNTPVPGYAAIFNGQSHIELVAEVGPDGTVSYVGGNTGEGEVKHRPRPGISGYVALDGGHPVAQTLAAVLQQAYNNKYNPGMTGGAYAYSGDINALLNSYMGRPVNLDVTGSGLENPAWFQRWQPPQQVLRWAPQVLTVLRMLGQPESLLKGVLFAINGESGGDPMSTYLGDINVIYGGSKGLLQTITPNFDKWKNPLLPNDIYDPMQNIWTCLREMQDTYGGISNLINRKIRRGKWSGYKVGSRYIPNDMLTMVHQGEAIIPASQNPYVNSGGDYLRSLVGAMFANDDGLNSVDTNSFKESGNSYNQTISINSPIEIHIDGDTDSAEIADNIAGELHRALQQAIAVGNPR